MVCNFVNCFGVVVRLLFLQAKVLIGEPGHPVANGTTGRKTGRLAPVNPETRRPGLPATCDHDFGAFAKASVSVNLFQSVPYDIAESWLRGQVHLVIRDCAFHPSNSFRHVAELILQIVTRSCLKARRTPPKSIAEFIDMAAEQKRHILQYVPVVLVLSTDGGADHSINTVQNQSAWAVALKHVSAVSVVPLLARACEAHVVVFDFC
jgi:hypothetical protein